MKAVIASLLFLTAAVAFGQDAVRPIPNETTETKAEIDTEFISLNIWLQTLDRKTSDWNERCHDSVDSDGCRATQAKISQEITAWIGQAKEYKSPGEGCAKNLRQRIVDNEVAFAEFNLKYGGVMTPPDKQKAKASEFSVILNERISIGKDLPGCENSAPASLSPKI